MTGRAMRDLKARLAAQVAAMPKYPTCGGFAIPSAQVPDTFVCKDHGRFAAPTS
jgi:hypothetical protein